MACTGAWGEALGDAAPFEPRGSPRIGRRAMTGPHPDALPRDPPLVVRARCYAKVNLGLAVYGPRGDGYHDVRTILQTISLADVLDARPARGLRLQVIPPVVPSDRTNLVLRAARALQAATGTRAGASLTLAKRIPIGAGLGGGSSDAAAALRVLSRLWRLRPRRGLLAEIARDLGADVPCFLRGGTLLAVGRGDELTPRPPLRGVHVVVLVPGFGVSTRAAYRAVKWRLTPPDAIASIAKAPGSARGRASHPRAVHQIELYNSFEASVFASHPRLRLLKRRLRTAGASAAALSGTGSAVFGLVRSREDAVRVAARCAEPGVLCFTARPVRVGSRVTEDEEDPSARHVTRMVRDTSPSR